MTKINLEENILLDSNAIVVTKSEAEDENGGIVKLPAVSIMSFLSFKPLKAMNIAGKDVEKLFEDKLFATLGFSIGMLGLFINTGDFLPQLTSNIQNDQKPLLEIIDEMVRLNSEGKFIDLVVITKSHIGSNAVMFISIDVSKETVFQRTYAS